MTLIALLIAPPAFLTLCFAIELIAGALPFRTNLASSDTRFTSIIVVPAHNEERIVARTISNLKAAVAGCAEILVVADNCDDQTAVIAEAAGATVINREDPENRGKGYALNFARETLQADPPDVVLIIDADCEVTSEGIEQITRHCALSGRPCQATYVQAPSSSAPPTVQLSAFAFFVRNVIRQRALQRLTGHVHLVGTGMAFPWEIFARAPLGDGDIVEDLALGLELASTGSGAMLVESAVVWSDAANKTNTFEQRRRWEGGFLQTAKRWAPRVLARAVRDGDPRALWTAISLLIPPFALLLTIDVGMLFLAEVTSIAIGAAHWPIQVLGSVIVLAFAGLFVAWLLGGRRFVSFASLAQAPLYVLWKVPLYLALFRKGAPTEWVRTGRD